MLDKFKDECGVFGIFGHPEAANMTYLGLYALQHRGQESAGIAASDGERVRVSKAMGYVADVFDAPTLAELPEFLSPGGTEALGAVLEVLSASPERLSLRGIQSALAESGYSRDTVRTFVYGGTRDTLDV